MAGPADDAPTMSGWNLGLRFGLEVAALLALGAAGWRLGTGVWRWLTAAALPGVAAMAWGAFNVPGDPSRSGQAPIAVPGSGRLLLELVVLGAGVAASATVVGPRLAAAFAVLVVGHYVASVPRIRFLLSR